MPLAPNRLRELVIELVADEIVYAPEMAVEKVRLDAIGEYMETLQS